MYERLCVCDALVCVQMFVVGSPRDNKLSPIFFYLRDVRARHRHRERVNGKKVTEASFKYDSDMFCHLKAEAEVEAQMVFKMKICPRRRLT